MENDIRNKARKGCLLFIAMAAVITLACYGLYAMIAL